MTKGCDRKANHQNAFNKSRQIINVSLLWNLKFGHSGLLFNIDKAFDQLNWSYQIIVLKKLVNKHYFP